MLHFTRMLLFIALLLSPATSLLAQTAAVDPSGHWEGAIQVSGMEVRMEIDLVKNGKGELAGTFGQPDQHLTGLPLANFALDGRSIGFQIKGGAPGDRAFKGELSADGASISGDFASHQVGTVAFTLTRNGNPRIEATPRSAAIGKELEGTWNGTLDANGMVIRLVLTLSNQPDGTATGTVVNIDEGLELPITTITQKASSVIVEVKAIGGSYSGALSAEGTELVGTFAQGPATVPLTFRRAVHEGKR
jgi:hypothetical protein